MENKPLRTSLSIVGGIAVVAASETYPGFNEWLQLVPMPPIVRYTRCALENGMWGALIFKNNRRTRLLGRNEPRSNSRSKRFVLNHG